LKLSGTFHLLGCLHKALLTQAHRADGLYLHCDHVHSGRFAYTIKESQGQRGTRIHNRKITRVGPICTTVLRTSSVSAFRI
jgi:hypothetical protein